MNIHKMSLFHFRCMQNFAFQLSISDATAVQHQPFPPGSKEPGAIKIELLRFAKALNTKEA
ncbi:MAG TPA: hypothetical protein DCQ31_09950 [Bacteroidales bacterium]|nr:hypothetical protein [Bacteroidales bacterium]